MHVKGNVSTHRTTTVALVSAAALLPALAQAAPAAASAPGHAPPATVSAPSARVSTPHSLVSAAPPTPGVTLTTLAGGLALPWDAAQLPNGDVLFTQKAGTTSLRRTTGAVQVVATTQSDLFVGSESGLMGIVLDPAFATNRRYYTCQANRGSGTSPIDTRVIRWVLSADGTSAVRSGAPVVTGIPITTGQHGGCRLRFAPDGTLHVGTGDAITGTNPQDLSSLGGKTLRVRTDGTAPADNPFASRGGRAALVYTYGHRNVQGLALRPGTTQMWSAEHGPDRDDEVNALVRGGNYGWDPVPGYNQAVPMTDTVKFPSAVRARWSSGYPTVATSGVTFLQGSSWGRWEGALAVAELKGAGVRVLSITPDGRVTGSEQVAALDGTVGRVRTVQSVPGSAFLLTTSNGSGDRLARVAAVPPARPAWSPGTDVSPSGVGTVLRGQQVLAFVRGTDDKVWYTSQAGAGGAWASFRSLPATVASAPAAVSWDGARVDVFARSASGHLLHTWDPGTGWRPWEDLGGSLTSAPSAASLTRGTIDVFARGAGDALVHRRWDGSRWLPWTSGGGVLSAAPAASADRAHGTIAVLVRGSDALVYGSTWTAAGRATGWQRWGRETWSGLGAGQGGTDRVVLTRNGTTPVYIRGQLAVAMGSGQLSGAPAVTSRSSTSFVGLGRGLDGALYAYDGRAGRYGWSKVGGALR